MRGGSGLICFAEVNSISNCYSVKAEKPQFFHQSRFIPAKPLPASAAQVPAAPHLVDPGGNGPKLKPQIAGQHRLRSY
jgi:hypothetical protein